MDGRATGRFGAALFAILTLVLAAATAALGALARAGVCLHRLSAALNHDHRMMDGMTMSGSMVQADATCPIMLYAALVAGGLCLFSALTLVAMRHSGSTVSKAAAALVIRTRFGPLTAALCLAGAVPLAGAMALEDAFAGPSPGVLGLALVAAAAATSLGLLGLARLVTALARCVCVAIGAAFRRPCLASAGTIARLRPWVQLSFGVRLARRHPSRAPPALL